MKLEVVLAFSGFTLRFLLREMKLANLEPYLEIDLIMEHSDRQIIFLVTENLRYVCPPFICKSSISYFSMKTYGTEITKRP